MAQSAVIRQEFVYAGHNAVIHVVCYNRLQDCFVTCDDVSLRLWQPTTPPDLRVVALPPRTCHFIQAIAFVEPRQLYVASALDGTLKIYDHALHQVASVCTGRSAILSLVFDSTHSRLFSGGVDGCAAWDVRGKGALVGAEAMLNPLYDVAASPGFFHVATASTAPATSILHHTAPRASFVGVAPPSGSSFVIPAASSDHHPQKKRALHAHELAWVQSVQLHSDHSRVYAQRQHGVDVFSSVDGHHVDAFADLVPHEHGAITAFVVHEKTQYLVCGCRSGGLFILSVHPTSVVHVFKDHTLAVTALAVHLSSHLILSSSLDGTVRLWDLEARRQTHRLDIHQPVYALGLLTPTANPCRFYCRVRSAVQLFTIQSAAKEHLASRSPISVLQRVLLPTAATVTRPSDAVIPGETLSTTRRKPLTLASMDETLVSEESDWPSETLARQWIVAAGTDRTIRLFSGRAANEAPSFTWIPEEHALDVSGLSLHALGSKLFILLESQQLVIVDIRKPANSSENDEENDTKRRPHRVVDMNAVPLSIIGGPSNTTSHTATAPPLRKAAVTTDTPTTGGPHGSTNVAANAALRGAIRTVCCCYYPPIFRSPGSVVGGSSSNSDTQTQLKWFSRTFVNRRQQSKRDLKRLDELTNVSSATRSSSPTKGDTNSSGPAPLIQSDREWIVCGSEYGHLVFWHSGLTNSFQEAISLDAHDASVVAIAASASSPLCVSLDASRRVHVWQFQPVFTLRHIVELNDQPSCFVLAPTSEILLTGYDDGAVVFMNVSDSLTAVETLAAPSGGSDDNHDAMVSSGDFLDAKLIVLTASVDAVVKIWDQQKNLLRQIQIAMALTCLCFMNDDGDVMAGVATGIFIISKDDLLPDKLPVHAVNELPPLTSSHIQNKKLPFWLGGDEIESKESSHKIESSEASPPKTTAASTVPKGRLLFQKKATVRFQDPSDDPDATQDETLPVARVETDDHSPQETPARIPATWKRRIVGDSLAVLMGKSDGEPTLQPPVLRPLIATTYNQRATPPTTPQPQQSATSSRSLFPAKDPDWRDVIMYMDGFMETERGFLIGDLDLFMCNRPSSPGHPQKANEFAQRNRRLKPPSASSTIITELKSLACQRPPRSPSSSSTSSSLRTESPRSGREALGFGHSDAPLQYCKHQAPVPPKTKTPRKLWNAIGGEDRRLIAVQLNLPSL